jgi:hypothetical protein
MKVEMFFLKLNEQLETYNHQYNRLNEGKVYIGLPDFDFSTFTKVEKTYLVYYLSFFVAIDLLVYTYENQNYLKQKEILHLPKFEYGLTNIFINHNIIYDKYWVPFKTEIFNDVFQLGIDYLYLKLPEINHFNIFNQALHDKDFSMGMFSDELKKAIKNLSSAEHNIKLSNL